MNQLTFIQDLQLRQRVEDTFLRLKKNAGGLNGFAVIFKGKKETLFRPSDICWQYLKYNHRDYFEDSVYVLSRVSNYVESAKIQPNFDDYVRAFPIIHDWVLNRSPYKHLGLIKNVDFIHEYGQLYSTETPSMWIFGAEIHSRTLYENAQMAKTFYRLVTKEKIHESLAFILSHHIYFDYDYNAYRFCDYMRYNANHTLFYNNIDRNIYRRYLKNQPVQVDEIPFKNKSNYCPILGPWIVSADREDKERYDIWYGKSKRAVIEPEAEALKLDDDFGYEISSKDIKIIPQEKLHLWVKLFIEVNDLHGEIDSD